MFNPQPKPEKSQKDKKKSSYKPCAAEDCTNRIFSHGYCKNHQSLRTDDKYKKPCLNKAKEPTGEREMFDSIFDASDMRSFISGKDLKPWIGTKLFHNMFHHVLNKKLYKKFLLNPDNIILLTPQEHLDIHSLGRKELETKYGVENIARYFDLWNDLHQDYGKQ